MSNKESFIQKLLGSLLGGNDAEANKKKLLKNIAKNLSKTHFKFYKASADQALPLLGKFFFDLYKTLSSSQTLFNSQQNPNYYKNIIITSSLSDNQKQLIESLSEESIQEQSKSMDFKQLKEKIKGDISTFLSEFDQARVQQIDNLHQKLQVFKNLCCFDYYFVLKNCII